ncbi:hypothetical protein B0T22DRAFT_512276 [Podospora appendiculata]|uniref:DUF6536 domain-containing protein n=1 Tax=Podospora appendiculata TaxID=314037 RepID=A0AAE0XAH1_9PEZI|nr:hypothetical protein B0T22DRAFT_512276 [Podospora appendiculata]
MKQEETGRRVLFEGSCKTTKKLNTMLHLLINIISSLLLSASNYGMQCLSAPTRKEVDQVHAKGGWVDIGVPIIRNLASISRKRVLLWCFLGVSSIPLHFLYLAWAGSLQNLTNLKCIDEYAKMLQTSRRDVILDHISQLRQDAADWNPLSSSISYCLSKQEEEHCRLNFSVFFAIAILLAGVIKIAVLAITLVYPPDEPLLALGDAIASFISVPDAHSQRMYILGFTGFIGCLLFALTTMAGDRGFPGLWRLGLGTVSEKTMMEPNPRLGQIQGLARSVIQANMAHFLFSLIYFQCNSFFTNLLTAREWSQFAVRRKSLRVSSAPRGAQRERCFLQLPYRFGVPLLVLSVVIHWLLSQSIFVVAIEKMPGPGTSIVDGWHIITCGYSPLAILFGSVPYCLLLVSLLLAGSRRLPSGMPVVGSCRLAIAAACHSPDGRPRPDAPMVLL